MIRGNIITLSDNQKSIVVCGAESGLTDMFIVVLKNGFLRLIDQNKKTLLYSLGEVSTNKC